MRLNLDLIVPLDHTFWIATGDAYVMMISRLDCRAPAVVGGTIDRSGIPTGTDALTTPFGALMYHLLAHCTIFPHTTPFLGLPHNFFAYNTMCNLTI